MERRSHGLDPWSSTYPKTLICYKLSAELMSLRQSARLAETIATYPDSKDSAHPVINFAFARAGPAVIENTLLRMAEALDPYLERAFKNEFQRSLFVGSGRRRRPVSDILDLLLRLRSQMVAHRVKLGGLNGPAWAEVTSSFGSIWRFVEAVLDEIEGLLLDLEEAGAFESMAGQTVSIRQYSEFAQEDVRAVVEAANALVDPPSPDATP